MSARLVGALNAGWSARFSRSAASMLLLSRYIYIYIYACIFFEPPNVFPPAVLRDVLQDIVERKSAARRARVEALKRCNGGKGGTPLQKVNSARL